VINGADYTYEQVSETENAELILSGGTNNDGTIILTFTSPATDNQDASGTYTSTSTTGGSRTGEFTVLNGGNL